MIPLEEQDIYPDFGSEFLDFDSIWSGNFSQSSQSSSGQQLSVAQSATEKLAEVFWQNPALQPLYVAVSKSLSQETFAKAHDDVLKTFFESLRKEIENDQQLKTVRIFRHRAHRERVTDWIYKLAGPKLDREALRKRQKFLDHRESRDGILERYLKSQVEADKPGKHNPLETDSTDDEMEEAISHEELNSIVIFLTSGLSFEILRTNLHGLMAPEAVIKEALRTREVQVLETLLSKQLERVAVGEYAWIKELDTAGYSQAEIAQLLVEEASDSPWIYFQPHYSEDTSLPKADADFHVPGCVHGVDEIDTGAKSHTELLRNEDFHSDVQELCGIAGIVPTSCDRSSWNGIVNFDPDNTGATVTYGLLNPSTEDAGHVLLSRSAQTLERLLAAIACLQNLGQCCEEYTVITATSSYVVVQMEVIKVKDLQLLLDYAKSPTVQHELQSSGFEHMLNICWNILTVFKTSKSKLYEDNTIEAKLHVLALTVQFASLAFLSYSQAHLAPLRPFFLDTPLERGLLLGSSNTSNFGISLAQVKLTCLDDMLHSRVTVFRFEKSLGPTNPVEFGMASKLRCDLIASARDLIGELGLKLLPFVRKLC